MPRLENPPFPRGEYVTDVDAFAHRIGEVWEFDDLDLSVSGGVKTHRSNKQVLCRLVKNESGAALLPKRLGSYSTTAGEYGNVIDGYTTTDYAEGAPIDEWLPAAGVPDQAFFWIVVKGPATVLTPLAGAGFNGDITVGQRLVALTAVTAGATTAGRVACENITGSTQTADYSFILKQAANKIGRALSARTTGNTNADLLVDVERW